MKLTTASQNKSSNIKPISNVFKLKQLIQNAANPHPTQNKQNIQMINLQLTERNNHDHKNSKIVQTAGSVLPSKTPRSKSEISELKQDQIQCTKVQLTNLNLDKLKINPLCNSVKGSKNIQFKPISVITKSKSNKTISNKRIQGLSKSFRCKTSIRQDLSIDCFALGKKLGKGRFGNVYMALQRQTNFLLAIKIINKKQLKQSQMQEQLLSEIKLQSYMKHPNILQMYGVFHDQQNIYLMLELAEECLFKDLRRRTCYSEKDVAYYTKQIIEGLKYLHSQSIIHRDLKPENIMLVNNVIKIADFGWSVYSPLYKRQTFCGTLDYVPPQIVQGDYYDQRVDIWSLGVLIFQLSFGYAPFEGSNTEEQTFQRIVNGQFEIPDYVSDSLAKTIQYILIRDPRHRLNLKDIEQTPWLRFHNKQGRSISEDIWQFWENKRLIR